MVKAVVFDLFGVLVTDALEGIVNDLRASDKVKAEHIVKLVNAASKGLIETEASRSAVAKTLGVTIEEYKHTIKSGEVKNKELLDFTKRLRPRYKTGLLTNILQGGLAVRFTNDELTLYFDVVVASCDIGFAKPEPQAYEITADRLGVGLGECILVDDREDYCSGAKAVGMHAIQYRSYEQLKTDLLVYGVT